MSNLKLAEVDNQAVITVTDIEKGVKDLVQNWNNIQVKLKDRNLRKEDRENLVTTGKEVIRNILDIIIAGIHIGEVTKDDWVYFEQMLIQNNSLTQDTLTVS